MCDRWFTFNVSLVMLSAFSEVSSNTDVEILCSWNYVCSIPFLNLVKLGFQPSFWSLNVLFSLVLYRNHHIVTSFIDAFVFSLGNVSVWNDICPIYLTVLYQPCTSFLSRIFLAYQWLQRRLEGTRSRYVAFAVLLFFVCRKSSGYPWSCNRSSLLSPVCFKSPWALCSLKECSDQRSFLLRVMVWNSMDVLVSIRVLSTLCRHRVTVLNHRVPPWHTEKEHSPTSIVKWMLRCWMMRRSRKLCKTSIPYSMCGDD